MSGNLFSSFDPNLRIFIIKIRYNWIAALGGLIILPQGFFDLEETKLFKL